jgi:hypothetical protein
MISQFICAESQASRVAPEYGHPGQDAIHDNGRVLFHSPVRHELLNGIQEMTLVKGRVIVDTPAG